MQGRRGAPSHCASWRLGQAAGALISLHCASLTIVRVSQARVHARCAGPRGSLFVGPACAYTGARLARGALHCWRCRGGGQALVAHGRCYIRIAALHPPAATAGGRWQRRRGLNLMWRPSTSPCRSKQAGLAPQTPHHKSTHHARRRTATGPVPGPVGGCDRSRLLRGRRRCRLRQGWRVGAAARGAHALLPLLLTSQLCCCPCCFYYWPTLRLRRPCAPSHRLICRPPAACPQLADGGAEVPESVLNATLAAFDEQRVPGLVPNSPADALPQDQHWVPCSAAERDVVAMGCRKVRGRWGRACTH